MSKATAGEILKEAYAELAVMKAHVEVVQKSGIPPTLWPELERMRETINKVSAMVAEAGVQIRL